ncbi:Ger(x)C family spore germination protein [Cohnella cholangitidis]|uniref:Ger(X)C family spore germination protein n=1 Tax=Cohnella cholangitidis TaxID=2598458 RepID=A0A7G5C3I6_9BACL|nr:Ger(x)C family spore germination protein [Cohnella cholangitidis]QMV43770.1 Ger(x)C family spore germination protein [Cohnella cholangitidis]
MKGRITLLFLLLLSLVCAVSGCGFKDIDKRFFVVAMGIDRGSKSDTYRVTLRLAIPSSKIESGETKTEVESFEAPSIAEAVRHLKALVDKELDFGHCRVILFGKPLMEDGVSSPLKWLSRRRDIAMVSFMGMAEPDAFKVLKLHPQSERYPGNALFLTFGSEGTESSFTLTEYLFDWARRQKETGKDGYLPIIRRDTDNNSYRLDRVAFLDKQKLRLCLDPSETQLFNISAMHFDKSVIAVPYQGTRIVLALSQVKSRVSISKDSVPAVNYFVRAKGFLEESPQNLLEGNIDKIESMLQSNFNSQLEDLLYKIRDAGVDPYGFGLGYLAQHFGRSKEWEHWKRTYPDVSFRVTSRIVIDKSGLVK